MREKRREGPGSSSAVNFPCGDRQSSQGGRDRKSLLGQATVTPLRVGVLIPDTPADGGEHCGAWGRGKGLRYGEEGRAPWGVTCVKGQEGEAGGKRSTSGGRR